MNYEFTKTTSPITVKSINHNMCNLTYYSINIILFNETLQTTILC